MMKDTNFNTNKKTGFTTPDGYFDALEQRIVGKMHIKNQMDGVKDSGFNTPEGYFENLEGRILSSIENENEPKVVPLFRWKNALYISGIAASILLMFALFWNKPETLTFDSLETESVENYVFQEDFNSYDLALFLTTDGFSLDDMDEMTFSEENLEDYLLQNSDIEDLIIEQ